MLGATDWFPELDELRDPALRSACAAIIDTCLDRSTWSEADALPFLADLPDVDNVTHTREVVAVALAMADALEQRAGRRVDRDHLRAAALLHDASKWVEYAPGDNGAPELTRVGRTLPHPGYCVALALEHGLAEVIVEAIAAHSPFNAIATASPVAVLVHHADMVAMDSALLAAGRPSVCKVRRG